MFNFDDYTMVDVLKVAMRAEPALKAIITQQLDTSRPTESIIVFNKLARQFYNGTFPFHEVNPPFMVRLGINRDTFSQYYNTNKAYTLIIDSLRIQSKEQKVIRLDTWMFDRQYNTSQFLRCAKSVLDKNIHDELHKYLLPYQLAMMEDIEERIGKRIDVLPFFKWYEANKQSLARKNRGAFSISPMATTSEAIAYYLQFILTEQLQSCNIGSHDWFKFTDKLQNEYHISLEGGEVETVTYDTNYKHKPVTTLKGLL